MSMGGSLHLWSSRYSSWSIHCLTVVFLILTVGGAGVNTEEQVAQKQMDPTCGDQLPVTLAGVCSCQSDEMTCSYLNSTGQLAGLNLLHIRKLSINNSQLKCIGLADLSGLPNLKELEVSNSKVRRAICQERKRRHRKETTSTLVNLEILNLADNHLDNINNVGSLHSLKTLNLSHNSLEHIKPMFQELKSLEILDLSFNRLGGKINHSVFENLNSQSLQNIDLSGNPWVCTPSLSWLYPWSLTLSPAARSSLEGATCQIQNTNKVSPLLPVMKTYHSSVLPECPKGCQCELYHFPTKQQIDPVYTVLVNCSGQGFTEFPKVPRQTIILDLSNNKLSDDSYVGLDVVNYNYQEISGLSLSNNQLTTLDNKLMLMKLKRFFRADGNMIEEIPYDLSLMVQKYDIPIYMGGNPWTCGCNNEINNSNLRSRITDMSSVTCGSLSMPESIVGTNLDEIDSIILCPNTDDDADREVVMKLLCATLALLIVLVLGKLLYDYWHYRTRGALPWIVLKMP